MLEPLYDRVALEFITEEKSEGGLIIPKAAQEKDAFKAKVVAIGKGKWNVDTKEYVATLLKEGDEVFINPYLGMRIKIARDKIFIIQKEEEVLCRINP